MHKERLIAKLFTSNCLKAIADGDFSFIERLSNEDLLQEIDGTSLNTLYQSSYLYLSKKYRNEYIYKNEIAKKLFLSRHSPKTSTLLSEFRVGTNKADLVLLNGCSTCYEIKTEHDSLIRLNDQLKAYTQLFSKVYVVCPTNMIDDVNYLIPSNIGIIEFTKLNSLKEFRKSNIDLDLNINLMMQSLRKDEYISIAEEIYKLKIDVPNTKIFDLCTQIISQADKKLINTLFMKTLKSTRRLDYETINFLPNSLTNALISFKFTKNNIDHLIERFSENSSYVLSNNERET